MVRSAVVFLFLASVAFAQATSVSTPQALTGLEEPIQKVGRFLLVGSASKPVVAPIGLIVVERKDPAKPLVDVVVTATDKVNGEWVIVPVAEEEPGKFIIDKAGSWLVFVVGENVKPPNFFTLTVGPAPPPPPPPVVLGCTDPMALNFNPHATKDDGSCKYPVPPPVPVPTDPFGNIGQRVATWSAGLPKRKEVAAIFRTGVSQLLNPPPRPVPPGWPITINEIAAQIGKSKAAALGIDGVKWKAVSANINNDTFSRAANLTRNALAEYWTCVALGLEAGGAQ